MTPEEHLHRARLALDEAERRDGSAGNLGPSRLFGQATAHALVGILEHLTSTSEPPVDLDSEKAREVIVRHSQNAVSASFEAFGEALKNLPAP